MAKKMEERKKRGKINRKRANDWEVAKKKKRRRGRRRLRLGSAGTFFGSTADQESHRYSLHMNREHCWNLREK